METTQTVELAMINLELEGLGIIMYSPSLASHISEGEDYLTSNYLSAEQVQPHIQAGTLVGFGTGSPGKFILRINSGYPSIEELNATDSKLRLGIKVEDGAICIRDLYDLMDWSVDCPSEQQVFIKNGYYHVTVCSNIPDSGVIGDNQLITIHLQELPSMPKLGDLGVPSLF